MLKANFLAQSSKILHFQLLHLSFGHFSDTNRFRKEKQHEIIYKQRAA